MGRRGRKSRAHLALINSNRRDRITEVVDDDLPEPPDYLRPTTKAWWRSVVSTHPIQPHQYSVLEMAAAAKDTVETARLALAKHGLSYTDAKGMVRQRPEAAIMRDSRAGYLRCLRELGLLKVEPPEVDANAGVGGISYHQLAQRRGA